MTIDEKLEELRRELARQDAELAAGRALLADAPADIGVPFDPADLRDLEELCTVRTTATQPFVMGIRG